VLLLDEPLSSLDPGLREEMRALIRELQRETGITTLVVTHDQAEAVALADRIALLLDGRLAQHGRPEDLYRRPANETVARFFGGVNFLPGQARTAVFHCALGSLKLPGGTADGNGLLTIRPEFLRLAPGVNERTARITALTFLGTQTRVEISVAGQTLQALTTPDQTAALQVGQDIAVSLPPEALWLLPPRSA
jgi:putative spermidine/putrescine transport system ATP-binding protein